MTWLQCITGVKTTSWLRSHRQRSSNLLHSSIVEGSKPDRRCQEMHRNHHLSILFEGPLKPLEQTDGLVLQGVHIWGTRLSIAALFLRRGPGLGFLLWGLWFWQMCRFVESRGRHPALIDGTQRLRPQAEDTATGSGWWLEESGTHQVCTHCSRPPQCVMC